MTKQSEARTLVLNAAETLFAQRGYNAVTLRDIAKEVGIRHTSLYHHVPGGKEELYVEVTQRHMQRHQAGLTAAIEQAAPDIRSRLRAVADWLLSEPPMDMIRMTHSDLPAIAPSHARVISLKAYDSLIQPVINILKEAEVEGEITVEDTGLIGAGFVGMIENLFSVPTANLVESRQVMAYKLIDILLNGLLPRQ